MQGNNKPLTTIGDWATTFSDREGAKALTIKLIVLNRDPLPLQKRHSDYNEVCLTVTAITTNVSVKGLLCHIAASDVNKVAAHNN